MEHRAIFFDTDSNCWMAFSHPVEVVRASRPDEVADALAHVEDAVEQKGLFAGGFISYEAAPAFDSANTVRPGCPHPLLWFGLYKKGVAVSLPKPDFSALPQSWNSSVSRQQFDNAIDRIKEHIRCGDTYQVNYTFRMEAPFAGDPLSLFGALAHAQQSPLCAFVDAGDFAVCSASPELFFSLDNDLIVSRPMKGTARRGLYFEQDEEILAWLEKSSKNRAENVMIVDMIRNDMGRIARTGTVEVPKLFSVERYPTVFQMTSTVTARTDASLCSIMDALFPCASITGAPKVNTMAIIAELETTPRGVYTGCVGLIRPGRKALFNVAIRTVVVEKAANKALYGVGGGILWYSDTRDEFDECRLKAGVLTKRMPDFKLFETLLWIPGEGFFLLERHLLRICCSATYFGFMADRQKMALALEELARGFADGPRRVRLLLLPNGEIELEDSPAPAQNASDAPVRLKLAPSPVDEKNLFLYHKTTCRDIYTDAKRQAPDCDDILFYNSKGQITESTIANVVVEQNGVLVTPPVECGLLGGTFRAALLAQGKILEQPVSVDQVQEEGAKIFLINSVRKWRKAILLPK
jgi:para-aminobenzoate synthetase/4-amino-4-deoxychorismate lyase